MWDSGISIVKQLPGDHNSALGTSWGWAWGGNIQIQNNAQTRKVGEGRASAVMVGLGAGHDLRWWLPVSFLLSQH